MHKFPMLHTAASYLGYEVRCSCVKHCGACNADKPLEAFAKRGESGRQAFCRECRKAYDALRYQRVKVYHKRQVKNARAVLREWADSLKYGPCADCDDSFHPRAMQWDHVGDGKIAAVSTLVARGFSKQKILEEIAKCELVCANCHAMRTHYRTF